MDQRTDQLTADDMKSHELRRDIETRRESISDTVDEIENRVSPSHVAARQKYRMKSRLNRWKDNIMGMGNDMTDRVGDMAGDMADTVSQAPQALRRQTRGNPMAVGLIAVGAGALAASLLPETQQERRIAREMEPQIEDAVSKAKKMGQDMATEVKDSAGEAMDRVKDEASSAGDDLKQEANEARQRVGGDSGF